MFAKNRLNIKIKKENLFYSVTWLRWILALIAGIALSVSRKYIALSMFILASLVGFLENTMSRKHLIPWWVFAVILARDLFTVAIGTYLLVNDLMKDFRPTFLGKVSYFLQVVAFIQVIFAEEVDWILMSA